MILSLTTQEWCFPYQLQNYGSIHEIQIVFQELYFYLSNTTELLLVSFSRNFLTSSDSSFAWTLKIYPMNPFSYTHKEDNMLL